MRPSRRAESALRAAWRAIGLGGRRDEGAVGTSFAAWDSPWRWSAADEAASPAACNVCGWRGAGFTGCAHSESAVCPACGSIARDRFLFYCFVRRTAAGRWRVLETSPRLGDPYRRAMAAWFDYRASDFDQRAHRTDLQLDLQDLSLPDESIDVLLTPHVLEHVPDTGRALDEIHRVLAPGGRMFLQVPVLQGHTAPPATPELHGDRTPVFWRFGPGLTDVLREHGFRAGLLCTEGFHALVAAGAPSWPDPPSREFDVDALLAAARAEDLVPVADRETCRLLGFHPGYMFLTWEAVKER